VERHQTHVRAFPEAVWAGAAKVLYEGTKVREYGSELIIDFRTDALPH